jgi:HKD family nuclease
VREGKMDLEILNQPAAQSVGARVVEELESGRWDRFSCAVAFAKVSGVRHLWNPLRTFVATGGEAVLGIGTDLDGTSFEAVNFLAGAVAPNGHVIAVRHLSRGGPVSFHPKGYLFTNSAQGRVLAMIGSSNITEGGLFSNSELSVGIRIDRRQKKGALLADEIEDAIGAWLDTSSTHAVEVDPASLRELKSAGWLPSEATLRAAAKAARSGARSGRGRKTGSNPRGFAAEPAPVRRAPGALGNPLLLMPEAGRRAARPKPRRAPVVPVGSHDAFYIDITTGAKTELYLSKTAIAEDPAFFGHPFTGLSSPKKPGNPRQPELSPRPLVDLRVISPAETVLLEGQDHELHIWEYVKGRANQDVRMTIPQDMRRALPRGCILEMRRQPVRKGIAYQLDFLAPSSSRWKAARAIATSPVPNSKRRYGWA